MMNTNEKTPNRIVNPTILNKYTIAPDLIATIVGLCFLKSATIIGIYNATPNKHKNNEVSFKLLM